MFPRSITIVVVLITFNGRVVLLVFIRACYLVIISFHKYGRKATRDMFWDVFLEIGHLAVVVLFSIFFEFFSSSLVLLVFFFFVS